jgi:hypothetical protein
MLRAVLLAIGNYADEKADFGAQEGPRAEFCEIANLVHADIHSYASAVYFVRKQFRDRSSILHSLETATIGSTQQERTPHDYIQMSEGDAARCIGRGYRL